MTTWPEVLDALEAGATAMEAVVADPDRESAPVARFAPPEGLSPLPRELLARADAVLLRLRVAEQDLRARRDMVSQELALVGGRRSPAVAHYLDTHA